MSSTFLSINNVKKSFGKVQALVGVSLEVKENEFFALLGPSGCGKTTLLRALAGFETLDSGDISLQGSDLLSVVANKRPVNLMFQSYALFPHLSVFDNIAYGLKREKLPKDEINTRVLEVLETVGLTELAKRRPSQLSGGQKQRVALARAIVKKPKILLLDEPLSSLDRKVRSEMQLELKRLQREAGITFIVVTHDQEEAMSMANRIAVMNNGEVVQIATPIELYTSPANKFVADFIGTSNLISGVIEGKEFSVGPNISLPINPGAFKSGQKVVLVLRPEDFTIGSEGPLGGTVISSNFFGGTSLLLVDCGLGQLLKVCVPMDKIPELGTKIHLRWSVENSLVLADA